MKAVYIVHDEALAEEKVYFILAGDHDYPHGFTYDEDVMVVSDPEGPYMNGLTKVYPVLDPTLAEKIVYDPGCQDERSLKERITADAERKVEADSGQLEDEINKKVAAKFFDKFKYHYNPNWSRNFLEAQFLVEARAEAEAEAGVERKVEADLGHYQIAVFSSVEEVNQWLRENSHEVEPVNISVSHATNVHSYDVMAQYGFAPVATKITDVYVLLYRVK